MQMCRSLAQKEGMLVGGSAGLNLHAAVEISKTADPGSVIVAILADNGVKYLTKIYNNDWIKAKVSLPPATPGMFLDACFSKSGLAAAVQVCCFAPPCVLHTNCI